MLFLSYVFHYFNAFSERRRAHCECDWGQENSFIVSIVPIVLNVLTVPFQSTNATIREQYHRLVSRSQSLGVGTEATHCGY